MKNYYTIASASLLMFIAIALTYETTIMKKLDAKAAQLLEGNSAISAFHYLADTKFMIAVLVLLLITLWVQGRNYRTMAFVFFTFIGGFLLNRAIKNYFARPRPEIMDQLNSYSFPSTHSMLGLIYLMLVALVFSKIIFQKRKYKWPFYTATVLAICIGLSRVAESRHFLTDVLAGWSLGLAWLLICVIIYKRKVQH